MSAESGFEIGLIGLGKMGGNMRERLRKAGLTVVGYDRNKEISDAASLVDLVSKLHAPRKVWVMVPAGEPTRQTVLALGELLESGDVVIDGGNSKYTDDKVHAAKLAEKNIGFVDAGVSGGVWGLKNGYALMVGGDDKHVSLVQPAFDALKPEGEFGFVHAGAVGAGHFAKMVHNGIEYGMMQAYAEGYELLAACRRRRRRARNLQELARGHRHPLLAARSARQRTECRSQARQGSRLRRRFRRRPLDHRSRDRPRRPVACHHLRRCSRGSRRGRTSRRP